MARRPDDSNEETAVVLIEDDFSILPEAERVRLTDAWLASLRTTENKQLSVSGAELLEDARREHGW